MSYVIEHRTGEEISVRERADDLDSARELAKGILRDDLDLALGHFDESDAEQRREIRLAHRSTLAKLDELPVGQWLTYEADDLYRLRIVTAR